MINCKTARLQDALAGRLRFVDGEGCFSINFVRQPDRPGRRGYATGYQVAHEFTVVQGAGSVACLDMMRDFFGCGAIYINRRYDNHKEDLKRYCVTRRDSLANVIIPFFDRNPLQTIKQQNFLKFKTCMGLIQSGAHLTKAGLIEIVRLAETTNHCRSRAHIVRELEAREMGCGPAGA